MANAISNYFKKALLIGSFGGGINVNALPFGTLYCALVGSGYTFDIDLHIYRSSLTNEITGSGYTAGGFVLSSPSVQYDTSANQGILFASNISIQNITFNTSAQAAVLYGSTGLGIASDPLICYIDFVTGQAITAGTFQITWAAGGVLAIS